MEESSIRRYVVTQNIVMIYLHQYDGLLANPPIRNKFQIQSIFPDTIQNTDNTQPPAVYIDKIPADDTGSLDQWLKIHVRNVVEREFDTQVLQTLVSLD